jgi:hypothetical protein
MAEEVRRSSLKRDILEALAGHRPERVPFTIHHALFPQGELERALRNRGLAVIDKSVTPYLALTPGVSVEERQAVEQGRRTFHTTYHTPVGDLHGTRVLGPDGSTWVTRYPVAQASDLPVLEYLSRDTEYHPNRAAILARQQSLGEDGLVLCRMLRSPLQRLLVEWMGTEGVVFALTDDPGPMQRLLDVMARCDEPGFAVAMDSPAEALWSSENISSAITTPRLFERHCRPYYDRLAALARARGKPYGVHMDGKLRALKALIAESALDFIEGFTPPPIGDLSLEEARQAWPGKVLWTNFPGNELHRSDAEIVAYTMRLLTAGMPAGGFLLTLTEDFPTPERSLPLIAEGIARYEAGERLS